MKKQFVLFTILSVLFVVSIVMASGGQITPPIYQTDNVILTVPSNSTLGGPANLLTGVYTSYLQASTTNFSTLTFTSAGGDGSVSASYFIATSTATSTFSGGLTIETSGFVYDWQTNNVGIGTASPGNKLVVNGNVELLGSGASLTFENGLLGFSYTGGYTHLSQTGGFRMYIDANNNDTSNFEIYGDVAAGTTAGALLTVTDLGKVGIGTTSPQTALSVKGYGTFFETATTTACTNLIEGSMFYNQANGHFWGCVSGGTWKRLEVD